ncbi:MAG: sigma-70 family RNA polymerase sigma factor [Acidobacteriota bacterium]|nr:sigma-70 family RNA polymerase sigma factor [Acidobacteriota bacterium]
MNAGVIRPEHLPGAAFPRTASFPPLPEADLIARLHAGDDSAFETLVRRESGRLLAVARHLLPSEEDARDALQEAFLSAFRSLGRFRGGSSLSTWLHRILINTALMKLRTARRRPETPIEELLPKFDGQGHLVSAGTWATGPEAGALRAETRTRVRAAIDRLPTRYRIVLVLRDIEELTTEEVARALDLTPAAVKLRLHRARLALRTLLEPLFGAVSGIDARA